MNHQQLLKHIIRVCTKWYVEMYLFHSGFQPSITWLLVCMCRGAGSIIIYIGPANGSAVK